MKVVDASAVLEVLLQTRSAAAVEAKLFDGSTLHAPHLLDLEVAQVLRRFEQAGRIGPERAGQALEDLLAFSIERYPHDILLRRVWSLRPNATAYDASYLALAEALDAPLLTRDRRLATTPGHGARVEIVG